MGETWQYLLVALTIPGLAIILGLGWFAFLDGALKQRHKD